MKRIAILAIVTGLALGAMPAGTAQAEDSPPPNAIVSEGNGAAVFIGYGGDKSVNLSWRPSKKYESANMLYQVQRSDGAMLESKTSASEFKDVDLTPNSVYGYTLITFKALKKTYTMTSGPSKGQTITRTVTRRVGRNQINVMTLPSMVVGLTASAGLDSMSLTWQPPQYTANPVTYTVTMDGNVMGYNITALNFQQGGLVCAHSYSVVVLTQNTAGYSAVSAKLSVRTATCPKE